MKNPLRRSPAHITNAPKMLNYTLADLNGRFLFLPAVVPDYTRAVRIVARTNKPHYFSTPSGFIVRVEP